MENEKQYGNLIQNIPEAIYTCDLKGRIQLYNKAAVNLWGKEPVAGKDLWCGSWKIFDKHGVDLPVEKTPMAIALKEARLIYGEEIIVQRPDGSLRHINPYSTPLYNSAGQLTGAINMLMEISKKRKQQSHSEEKYRTFIEQASDGILIYSFDGIIHEFNKSCYTLLGYTRNEYANLNLKDIIVGDIIVSKTNYEAIIDGDAKTVYRQLKRKDGTLMEAAITVKMLANGKAIAFARDISEHKKTAQALAESEVFNQSILTSITSHIAVADYNGNIISVNKAWNDFSTQNGECILARTGIGTNYIAVCERSVAVGEPLAAVALNGFKNVINKEIPFFEIEYPCHSLNEKRWFLLRITNFADNSAKVVMMHIDITERVKAADKMHNALERYDILAKATSDTIWDWDIVKNEIKYNDVVTQMFGYTLSSTDNLVAWWKKNIHPDDQQRVSTSLEQVFKNKLQHFQLEYRFRCEDNSYKYIYDRAFVIFDENQKPNRVIGAMQDITERKKAEYEFEQVKRELMNQKIEEQKKITRAIIKAQEKERRHMGEELHDNVNQMLAGVKLYLSVAGSNNQQLKQPLQYPLELIDDTMSEIRMLTSRSVTPKQNINLKELVESLFETMYKNVAINTKFVYDVKSDLTDDDLKLNIYRILQEQTNNIVKHACANNVKVEIKTSSTIVEIIVTDDGNGFDVNKKRDGIGISNIINRVQSFNGDIEIKTSPGNGCKLIIKIPFN